MTKELHERLSRLGAGWQIYTPSLTNLTIGNGTGHDEFRWCYITANLIRVRGDIVLGSTSSFSGNFSFGLPTEVSANTTDNVRNIGTAWLLDATGTDVVGSCMNTGSNNSVFVYGNAVDAVTASNPFTWTTSDQIAVDIQVEVA